MLFPSWNLISLGMQAPFSMPAGSSSGVGFPRPQENTVYNIPTVVATEWLSSSSPLFCLTGVSSCPCCCQPVAWEAAQWLLVNFVRGGKKRRKKEGQRTPQPTISTPNHSPLQPHRPWQLHSFVPHPRHPPSPCQGIFSVVENPSHEQCSSTEVINHG